MAYRLTIKQQDPESTSSWIWEIVHSRRLGWVKRSMTSFRSSGLATAAGVAALKQLSTPTVVTDHALGPKRAVR